MRMSKVNIFLQVLNEMYEKAVSFETMDYQLVFWGYTFAIKKLTWFAQVCRDK